ncbi:MAG: hypothetical protein ACRC8A_19010 [Microcoleaceae cyanobacterium]
MLDFQCSTMPLEFEEHLRLRNYQETWIQALFEETKFELEQLSRIPEMTLIPEEPWEIPQGSFLEFLDSMSQETIESQKERKTLAELQERYQKLLYHRVWLNRLLQQVHRDVKAATLVTSSA